MQGLQPAATRRDALTGLLASAAGILGWREAQARGDAGPLYLTCRADGELRHHLTALDRRGAVCFDLALPGRGHGMALHPRRPEGVVFARRPGRFAVVFDHAEGIALRRFDAGPGRHFYGHGVFTGDGRHLLTTENDWEAGRGVVGVRDCADGYRQIGEFGSGGIGPHELVPMPGGGDLVAVANGGIRTHPDRDRDNLNLETMRPSLAYVEVASGRLAGEVRLAPERHRSSIRHLDVAADGRVAMALQHEGPASERVQLVALAHGETVRDLAIPPGQLERARNYIGSIAFDQSGRFIVATAPKGGIALAFDTSESGACIGSVPMREGCGVAAAGRPGRFVLTSGLGDLAGLTIETRAAALDAPIRVESSLFDNHARLLG